MVCEVVRDIPEDTELVAMLNRDMDVDVVSTDLPSPSHSLLDNGITDAQMPAHLPANCTFIKANFHLTLPDNQDSKQNSPDSEEDTSSNRKSPPSESSPEPSFRKFNLFVFTCQIICMLFWFENYKLDNILFFSI